MDARVIKYIFYCIIAFALWCTFSCNDPASIDTNLIDVDLLDIQKESDFEITSFTIGEDSVVTYQPGLVSIDKYPFGINEDPVFGTTSSSIVSQVYITTISPPSFTGAVVDSVVMEMTLNPIEPFYGDSTGTVGLEVFEITETLDPANTFYSNYRVETEAMSIGSYEGVPNFRDSVSIIRYQADTLFMDTFPPQISFKIDNEYGNRIINAGEDILSSSVEFSSMFKGIEIRPTNTNEGLIAFNLRSFNANRTPNVNGARISIYYTQDGINRQYNLDLNPSLAVKFPQYNQDYAGSNVDEFIGDVVLGDSLIFVQGMAGVNAIVSFNDIDRLNGSLVNGATLEVYGTALNGDEDIRPVPEQLVLRELSDAGELFFTRDFLSASQAGSLSISGGEPVDIGGGIFKYTFQVGSQLQDIIAGDRPEEVYIQASAKTANMRRVVLFGAGHSTYPIKLNVTYTKL